MSSRREHAYLLGRALRVARAQRDRIDVGESLARALARIAPGEPRHLVLDHDRDVASVSGCLRDALLARHALQVEADLGRVDLAVAVARVHPRDDPAVSGPGERDVARVTFLGSQLHLVRLAAPLVEASDVDLRVAVVARDPRDGDAILGAARLRRGRRRQRARRAM